MLIKYKTYVELPSAMLFKIKKFVNAIDCIKTKMMDLYEKYAIDGRSTCLHIDRSGDVVKIDPTLEFERDGIMDLWMCPLMDIEKDTYV